MLLLFALGLFWREPDIDSLSFYELENPGWGDNLYRLIIFEVCQVMVAGNDKVGLTGNGSLQDPVIGVISTNCQKLLRMHLFREIFYPPNRTLRFGIIPQGLFLDYPFDLFGNLRRDYIEDSFLRAKKTTPAGLDSGR